MNVTRGMQRRTAKVTRRSQIVSEHTLVAGVDLAKRASVAMFVRADDKQRVDYLRIRPGEVGIRQLVSRGQGLLEGQGLSKLVVAMEATGNLWKIAARACEDIGVDYVIVQSFVVARAREFDDLTRDKNDRRDAGLIADLAADRRFTDVKLDHGPWSQLRLYADARDEQRVRRSADLQEQRSFLELVWPELLEQLPDLQGAHVQAILRLGLSPQQIATMTRGRFIRLLRREQSERRFLEFIAERIWTAATQAKPWDEIEATALRWQCAAQRVLAADRSIALYEERMLATFEQTGLGWMQHQIPGLGDVALAGIMGLAGDVRRFDDSGCIVKLAGSNPTDRSSGDTVAQAGIHRRGRPTLRTLAWQAAVNLIRHNPDFGDRFRDLTSRQQRPLKRKPAQVAVANKLLRILWAMAITGEPYSSELATRGRTPTKAAAA